MKILKNKKGFTLIELLAVIVVLAIIMVIATTAINSTIRKSRADSFVESYQIMYKSARQSAMMGNTIKEATDELDYSEADYNVSLNISKTDGTFSLTVCAAGITLSNGSKSGTASGKFSNMSLIDYYQTKSASGDKTVISSNIGSGYTLTDHCISSTENY